VEVRIETRDVTGEQRWVETLGGRRVSSHPGKIEEVRF